MLTDDDLDDDLDDQPRHDGPPPQPPTVAAPRPRRHRWWLALLAVLLIGSGVLVARYALPKSAPSPGAAPPPATGRAQPAPVISGEIIPPTGGNPVITVPARPADALSDWAAQVAPAAQIPLVALQAYGYAQLSLEGTAPQCHLSWTTLAGIGQVESQHGQLSGAVLSPTGRSIPPILGPPLDGTQGRALVNDTDAGAFDGDPKWDHAMGPLGILPGAWKQFAIDADARRDSRPVRRRRLRAGDGPPAVRGRERHGRTGRLDEGDRPAAPGRGVRPVGLQRRR